MTLEIVRHRRPHRPPHRRPGPRFYGSYPPPYYPPVYQEPIVLEVERTVTSPPLPWRAVITAGEKKFVFHGTSASEALDKAKLAEPEIRKKSRGVRVTVQLQRWSGESWVNT